jgi:hypothetical protein
MHLFVLTLGIFLFLGWLTIRFYFIVTSPRVSDATHTISLESVRYDVTVYITPLENQIIDGLFLGMVVAAVIGIWTYSRCDFDLRSKELDRKKQEIPEQAHDDRTLS